MAVGPPHRPRRTKMAVQEGAIEFASWSKNVVTVGGGVAWAAVGCGCVLAPASGIPRLTPSGRACKLSPGAPIPAPGLPGEVVDGPSVSASASLVEHSSPDDDLLRRAGGVAVLAEGNFGRRTSAR